jgi:N-acetylmuramoyl-L-alanine amidase
VESKPCLYRAAAGVVLMAFVACGVDPRDADKPAPSAVSTSAPALNDRELYAPAAPLAAATQAAAPFDVSAFASERARPAGATLQAISVYGNGALAQAPSQEVRVVLGFDAAAVFRRGELAAADGLPRRVFLDLDDVRVARALQTALSVGAGGLSRVRTFALDASTTRVSFDVEADAVYRLFLLTNPYRVILDFKRVRAREPGKQAALRTIVLDPGHGGSKDGARGPTGLEESVVVLQLARLVKHELQARLPGTKVVLTRTSDATVSLEERSAIANGLDADLFVSLHLDASPSAADRGGVSTYVLDISDDKQALRLAARENDADEHDITQLQKLFASLYRKDQLSKSLALAEAIQSSTLKSARHILPELPDRGVQKALFYVLVGASMPAVLCEASFITRPEEEAALATEAYRQALAEGIADGIVRYVDKLARQRAAAAR